MGVLAGIAARERFTESQGATQAAGLSSDSSTPIPLKSPKSWGNGEPSPLGRWCARTELGRAPDPSRQKLHASLALLPIDPSQLPFLEKRLLTANAAEISILRDALEPHRASLTLKLWAVVEAAKPGDPGLLPAARPWAAYNPDDSRWQAAANKVSRALVTVNSIYLRPWLDGLRPVRAELLKPLCGIFREKGPESEHSQATNILSDYASEDPAWWPTC